MDVAAGTPLIIAHPIPLHWAAANGRPDRIEAALAAGGGVNVADDKGDTALHHAVRHGSLECVRLLLASDADANAPACGPHGKQQTPLHTAVRAAPKRPLADSLAILRELLTAGADPGKLNSVQQSPFHVAVMAGAMELCAEMLNALPLPEHRAALLAAPADGPALSQPVHLAAALGNGLMLRWLLEQGADPRALDARGRTPADVAGAAGHSQVRYT